MTIQVLVVSICCKRFQTLVDRVTNDLKPTRSEQREVFGVESIPVAILPSCQDMKTIALQCREINIVG